MRLTVNSETDGKFAQIEVASGETVENVKAILEVELGVPVNQQLVLHNGKVLQNAQTLEAAGVGADDMLTVRRGQVSLPTDASVEQIPTNLRIGDVPGDADPALLIRIFQANPHLIEELRHGNAPLAEALASLNVAKVRGVRMQQQMAEALAKTQEKLALDALYARIAKDPFDMEAQRKIEEMMRAQNVKDNYELATEEMPESFGRVVMLYVPLEVNGCALTAMVDSGAQQTIMSEACARRCGIMRLVDQRFAGMAKGVGTSKIIGKVHMVQLKIGGHFFNCSFTCESSLLSLPLASLMFFLKTPSSESPSA